VNIELITGIAFDSTVADMAMLGVSIDVDVWIAETETTVVAWAVALNCTVVSIVDGVDVALFSV